MMRAKAGGKNVSGNETSVIEMVVVQLCVVGAILAAHVTAFKNPYNPKEEERKPRF